MLFQFWNSIALQVAIQSCGLGKGDEILVPCITYVATYQAISATGAKPVLCDIDPKNLNIDLNNLKKKLQKKLKLSFQFILVVILAIWMRYMPFQKK